MADIYQDDMVLLVKKEATYGTDPAPTQAILTRNFAITPAQGTNQERQLDRPGFGSQPMLVSGVHSSCRFEVEMRGGGAADTPPKFADILLGAAHSETVNVGTSVVYDPVSSGFDSVTLHSHVGGIRSIVTGARGKLSLNLSAGQVPFFGFEFMGLYNALTDTATPAADFSGFAAPQTVEKANTPTVTLAGVNVELISLTLDANQAVNYRNLPNLENVSTTGRAATGRIEFLKSAVSVINPPALYKAETLSVLQAVHGTGAGNICQIDAPAVQITGVSTGNSNGEETWQLDLNFTHTDAGDDDYTLTFK